MVIKKKKKKKIQFQKETENEKKFFLKKKSGNAGPRTMYIGVRSRNSPLYAFLQGRN
jgi:hypothetical protein